MATEPSPVNGARMAAGRISRSAQGHNPDGRMPLMDHLRELRNRVVKIALTVLAGGIVGWVFYNRIWTFLQRPYCHAVTYCRIDQLGHTLTYSGVTDGFYLHLKVGILAGVIIGSPIWLYQIWAFIGPGLYSREKRWTYTFIGVAVPLFGLGCYFAYLAMSRGLQFFLGVSGGSITAQFSADSYLGYWIAMIIGFALCFEVPLFLAMLNVTRIVTHARFRKSRRIVLFLVFVFAGIASPSPDPLTMLLLGGTVGLLVEVAELFMFFNDRAYARRHPDLYADLNDDEVAPIENPEHVDTVP